MIKILQLIGNIAEMFPVSFAICFIFIAMMILFTVNFHINNLIRYIDEYYTEIELSNKTIVKARLYRTYCNGKIFKYKDKLIITDHTNCQIPCLELEMLN